MNRLLKCVWIIGSVLLFLILQVTVIKEQRLEITNISEVLSLAYHEYDYYNHIEINGDVIKTQDEKWIEMENQITLDFTNTVESLKQDFHNHGWFIKDFQRLENNTIVKSEDENTAPLGPYNFISHESIPYEVQFDVMNGKIHLPQNICSDAVTIFEIKNLVIRVQDQEIRGVLSFIYHKLEISKESILKI